MTLDEMIGKTGKRLASFNIMKGYLDTIQNPVIVETGCAREEDNFEGDGMSTLIFDEYVRTHGGTFYSVDIDPKCTKFAKEKCPDINIHTGDSVPFLYNFKEQIDLLYLDSYDFDIEKPHPSAFHHIKELMAAFPKLKKGSMIVVDDNFLATTKQNKDQIFEIGKGTYVKEFMDNIGINRHFVGHQWIWIL